MDNELVGWIVKLVGSWIGGSLVAAIAWSLFMRGARASSVGSHEGASKPDRPQAPGAQNDSGLDEIQAA